MKLNPEELAVSSFDTMADAGSTIGPILTNDPTDATRCYICPMETYRCY